MRRGICFIVVVGAFCLFLAPVASAADGWYIELIIAGVGGDTSAQAIQFVSRGADPFNASVFARDDTNSNPVALWVGNINNSPTAGDRVLLTTLAFDALTTPPTVPDDTLLNRIPDAFIPVGTSDVGASWGLPRLAWGGSSYTGATGTASWDDDLDIGTPFPSGLPTSGTQVLKFLPSILTIHTTNAADYGLVSTPVTFTNNAGTTFVLGTSGGGGPVDTDSDGLTDSQETALGTNASDPDSDNDGFNDGFEIAFGTDPTDDLSFPLGLPIGGAVGLSMLALCLLGAGVVRFRRRSTK